MALGGNSTAKLSLILDLQDKATKELKNASKGVSDILPSWKQLAVAGTAIFATLTKLGSDLQGLNVELVRGTGMTGKALEELNAVGRNVAKQVPQNLTEVGIALAELNTRLGLQGTELEKTGKVALDFARVHQLQVGPAIQGMGRLFNALKLDSSEVPLLLDKITTAAQASGIQADRLIQTIVEAGPAFENLGFDVDRSIALFSQFEKVGARPEEIVSSLGLAMNKLAKEGATDFQAAFEETIQKIKELDLAQAILLSNDLFGARAGAKIADDIRAGNFEIEGMLELLNQSEGSLARTAEATLKWTDRLKILKNELTIAVAPAAEAVIEIIEKMIATASRIVEDTRNWINENETVKKVLIELARQVRAVWEKLTELWELLGPGLIPVLKFLAVVVGTTLVAAIGTLAKVLEGLLAIVQWVVEGIVKFFTWLFEKLIGNSIIPDLVAAIKKAFTEWASNTIALFKETWERIVGIFSNAASRIKSIVDRIKSMASSIGGAVTGAVSKATTAAKNVIGVNDALITKKGDVVKFHPDDNILAFKGAMPGGGGPSININISGNSFLGNPREAARELGNELVRYLKENTRI